MTDNNHFDHKTVLFTMNFPPVSDISIYYSPTALQSIVAAICCETKLPALIEVSNVLYKRFL